MIPDFCETEVWPYDEDCPYLVLPEGIFASDMSEVNLRFVFNFPRSDSRQEVHNKFCDLLREIHSQGLHLTHWLGGSFISSKENPEDIDVCTFVHNNHLLEFSIGQQNFIERFTKQRGRIHDRYLTDQILVIVMDRDHPMFSIYEETREYWKKHYGFTRKQRDPNNPEDLSARLPEAPRGIVRVVSGDPSLCPSEYSEEVNDHENE